MIDPKVLLRGYVAGSFPMANPRTEEVEWFSPDPRGVLELDDLRISRSLRRTIRRAVFEIRIDTMFEPVMRACADRSETWISEELIVAYCELHRMGWGHSVETWSEDRLVGGLYGVSYGAAFFGESMFSRETDASKVALTALVRRLKERGCMLLDIQYLTPHLESMGAKEISRTEYLERLAVAIQQNRMF